MSTGTRRDSTELDYFEAQSEEFQRYLFDAFTLIALAFLLVYAILQAKHRIFGLAGVYGLAAGVILVNWWMINYHNRLTIAANVFAALGPIVLLPWQITGGLAHTGLLWFPAYVVFAMLFLPGRWGSFWVACTYAASFFLLILQVQGTLALPFDTDMMFHFYFVGGITYAMTFLFVKAQRIIVEVLQMRVASLRTVGETSLTGSWTWDIARDKAHWSDELYGIYGVKPGRNITYKTYLKWVHSEDRPLVEQTVDEALCDHHPFSVIHRIKRPDDSMIWVHTLGEVMVGAGGDPVKIVGSSQDITSRLANKTSSVYRS
ncbi:MAG TPA: PAS domain-containing protein [Verrucomicrobiae bacterium]|nr:PAS domain-containing protein [Verrucomicrobiae bacterium]